jgi:hypothetical protein
MNLVPRRRPFLALIAILGFFALTLTPSLLHAQKAFEGVTWTKIADPGFVLQLQSANAVSEENTKGFALFTWKDIKPDQPLVQNDCTYLVTNKTDDYSTAVHTFTISANPKAKRAEMKVEYYEKYADDGIYQMEGELRFTQGILSPHHVAQIWQNMKITQNKILIFSTSKDDQGTLRVPPNKERIGEFRPLKSLTADYNDITGRWLKVNVIHVRATRMVYVYLNGELYNSYEHGPADGDYYFKFGAYGKLDNKQPASSTWRNITMFEGKR